MRGRLNLSRMCVKFTPNLIPDARLPLKIPATLEFPTTFVFTICVLILRRA